MALYVVNPGAGIAAADINQFTNVLNGTTSGVTLANGSRIRAQLTGATSGSGGLVGQVSGAHPTGPSNVVGDFAVDGTLGALWTCLNSGSPGTWTGTLAALGETLVGSATASVTFSSIPQGYNHLVCIVQAKSSNTSNFTADNIQVTFNGVTTNGYNWASAVNNGTSSSAAAFFSGQSQIQLGAVWTSFSGNTPGTGTLFYVIPYYSQSTFGKNMFGFGYTSDGGGASQVSFGGGSQNIGVSQSAITSMTWSLASGGNILTNSWFGIYGAV